jgi:hypothetical protein
MTFNELGADYARVPHLEPSDVQLLWACDFWDGPLNGVLTFRGERHWYETVAGGPDDPSRARVAVVVRLTPEQLAEEERWHRLFQEKVGTHMDVVPGRNWTPDLVEPQDKHHEFYEPYAKRAPLEIGDGDVLGWFEL